ncbi:MAG: hypothetical protein ACYDHW_09925 [Syntrophorhabdaceae bacterium]
MTRKNKRNPEKEIVGRVIYVQEERFRMVDQKGRSFLFDLAHNAPVSDKDLINWSRSNTSLVVGYEGEPELESGIARSIRTV